MDSFENEGGATSRLSNTYSVNVFCKNCGHDEQKEIPKGVPVTRAECSNCGLSALTRNDGFPHL